MGNCASPQCTRKDGSINRSSTGKIIHLDGRLQEFKQPIRAGHVLSHNPNSFICSSESMYVNSHVPHVSEEEELQLGQIYFLMPVSKSNEPLSLQELCSLAIKASKALAPLNHYSSEKAVQVSGHVNSFTLTNGNKGCCKVPIN